MIEYKESIFKSNKIGFQQKNILLINFQISRFFHRFVTSLRSSRGARATGVASRSAS